MGLTAYIGNLKTHEIKIKAREDSEPQKKVGVAFKASPRKHKKKSVATPTISDDEKEDDEELTLFVKNMRRMYHKVEGAKEKRQEKKDKKKAMKITTCDSDSESE